MVFYLNKMIHCCTNLDYDTLCKDKGPFRHITPSINSTSACLLLFMILPLECIWAQMIAWYKHTYSRIQNVKTCCCFTMFPRSHSWFYFQTGREVCSRLSLKRTWVYSAEEPEWKAKRRAEIRTSPTEIRPSSTLTTNQKHSLKIRRGFSPPFDDTNLKGNFNMAAYKGTDTEEMSDPLQKS